MFIVYIDRGSELSGIFLLFSRCSRSYFVFGLGRNLFVGLLRDFFWEEVGNFEKTFERFFD